ncbi:MAG: D-alanyl-D-alanine carboxypeptidase, partial [Bacteroidaceae bacterium]|nr:D-alanyl-D-alanine carboxypeptidase [Bacteroidaceae bacterium]
MAKKKKRRLKRWVKVVLWCMALALGTWIIWWPAHALHEYWAEASINNEIKENRTHAIEPTHGRDSIMEERLARFIVSPTRLDTTDIAVSVWDLSSNTPVLQWHDQELMVPASSLKLLTAISALKRLGTDQRYHERV